MSTGQPLKILFICGRNQRRSPTAEKIFRNDPRLTVRSAGTAESSRRRIGEPDLLWADNILVMERKYEARIKSLFPGFHSLPPIILLDIPDEYTFMAPELIDLLTGSVESFLSEKDEQVN
ncbi:MAG: phosphotyrosine protein phosphatase [Verrucomicrobiota bacterium]|nr:phosphotyrosine protein phosphatase [Verrucomicrobiota bacterium]